MTGSLDSVPWSAEKDGDERYGVVELFKILVIVLSALPTTIFLAGIIACGTIILYLCTLGFALSIASVVGLSMFVYGPVLCVCIISALACSILYNVGLFIEDIALLCWYQLRLIKNQLMRSASTRTVSPVLYSQDCWSAPPSPPEKEDWRMLFTRGYPAAVPLSSALAGKGSLQEQEKGKREYQQQTESPRQQMVKQQKIISGGRDPDTLPYIVQ
ncbi:hypothetical protein EDD11_006712 [Mortierella claussenii]|nr:hypothetical protein EDD11_006712 [Mortierella claussenii]